MQFFPLVTLTFIYNCFIWCTWRHFLYLLTIKTTIISCVFCPLHSDNNRAWSFSEDNVWFWEVMLFPRSTWIFVQFVLWMVRCMSYCICLKSITLCNCLSPSSVSLAHFFPEYRGIRSKNIFNPANSQHNSVICHYRRKFFWSIFFFLNKS